MQDSLALVAHNWRKLHGANTITFLHNLLQFYIIHGTNVESDFVEHCIKLLVLLLIILYIYWTCICAELQLMLLQ